MNVIYLLALLSLNLALVNILPFPALDGGRLLFILIRKITGKAVSDELEGKNTPYRHGDSLFSDDIYYTERLQYVHS